MRPLLLLEINEVPWRMIDRYQADPRFPALRRFFSRAATYTTFTVDEPSLMDPWVTWSSLHRGMDNTHHNVKNLGQDPSTFTGVPLWEEFRRLGHSIGICGSLQSWPPVDPGQGGFYIPDTFAHDEACFPAYVEPFQKFNLAQVARNGRVVRDGGLLSKDTLRLLASMPRLGISLKTVRRLVAQLVGERWDPTLRSRRPIFQANLSWDVFCKLFCAEAPPAFSTFFTNHVAGVMHRYWKHVFPEDFNGRYDDEPKVHLATMDFAMKILDEMLAEALAFIERNPRLILVFATSMGQGPIEYDWHQGFEASVVDLVSLLRVFGVDRQHYTPLLAMAPKAAVQVPDPVRRQALRMALETARTISGERLFVVLEIGASLSITLFTPKLADIEADGFRTTSGGALVPWAQAGIAMNKVEPGTAYHIPEGVMAVVGEGISAHDARERLAADQVKGLLLTLAGLRTSASSPGRW